MNLDELTSLTEIKIKEEPIKIIEDSSNWNDPNLQELEDDFENLFGSEDEEGQQEEMEIQTEERPTILIKKEPIELKIETKPNSIQLNRKIKASSRLGTETLRRFTRTIHKQKNIAVKNFTIDSKREKEKLVFLNDLERVIEGNRLKCIQIYEELKELESSILNEKPQEIINIIEENDDFLNPFKKDKNNGVQSKSKSSSSNHFLNIISKIEQRQKELEKRQKILGNICELTGQYLKKSELTSEKNNVFLNDCKKKVFDGIYDCIRFVNHYLMDYQKVDKMYISAKTTEQDIYRIDPPGPRIELSKREESEIISSSSVFDDSTPLYIPYFKVSAGNASHQKDQIHKQIKNTILMRSKKRRNKTTIPKEKN